MEGHRESEMGVAEWRDELFMEMEVIFSEQHPEISDPEYYLKEAVRYPGEANPGWNTKGEPKANYSWASVEELQKFVNSFDWIHLDAKNASSVCA